VSGVEALSG